MTFKKVEMAKTLRNGLSMIETNTPQPQLVRFRNLVGVGIAPVSKKTAVKCTAENFNQKKLIVNNLE